MSRSGDGLTVAVVVTGALSITVKPGKFLAVSVDESVSVLIR